MMIQCSWDFQIECYINEHIYRQDQTGKGLQIEKKKKEKKEPGEEPLEQRTLD